MEEIWKKIPGYEGMYSMSNLGNIRSDRVTTKSYIGKILKTTMCTGGYRYLHLHKLGVKKKFTVHELILLCFLGPRPKGYQVNHKDGVKTNNSIENLEYVTPIENSRHASRLGLLTRGENCKQAKLNPKKVKEIRILWPGISQRKIANKFGVSQHTIRKIVIGKSWRHV